MRLLNKANLFIKFISLFKEINIRCGKEMYIIHIDVYKRIFDYEYLMKHVEF